MHEFVLLLISDKNKRFYKSPVFFLGNGDGSHFYGFNLWSADRHNFHIFGALSI